MPFTLALLLLPSALLVSSYPVRTPSSVTQSTTQLFADAFLSSATGGKFDDVADVSGQFGTSLTLGLGIGDSAVARAIAFNRWAAGYCFGNYHDSNLCAEVSAYLSATYYAYENAWAGTDLFASLGSTRVERWHDLLEGVCARPTAPSAACTDLATEWSALYSSYTGAAVSDSLSLHAKLQEAGIVSMIDAATALDGTLSFTVRDAHSEQGRSHAKVKRQLEITADGALDALAGLDADLGPLGSIDIAALLGGEGDLAVKRDILADIIGGLDASANLDVGDNSLIDAVVALEGQGNLLVGRELGVPALAVADGAVDAVTHLELGDVVAADVLAALSGKGRLLIDRDLLASLEALLHADLGVDVGDGAPGADVDVGANALANVDLGEGGLDANVDADVGLDGEVDLRRGLADGGHLSASSGGTWRNPYSTLDRRTLLLPPLQAGEPSALLDALASVESLTGLELGDDGLNLVDTTDAAAGLLGELHLRKRVEA